MEDHFIDNFWVPVGLLKPWNRKNQGPRRQLRRMAGAADATTAMIPTAIQICDFSHLSLRSCQHTSQRLRYDRPGHSEVVSRFALSATWVDAAPDEDHMSLSGSRAMCRVDCWPRGYICRDCIYAQKVLVLAAR